MSERSPAEYVAQFAEALDSLGADWVIIGGLAALRYREKQRFTTDADFLARHVEGIKKLFESQGFTVRTMIQPGDAAPYVYFVRGNGMSVDVLISETEYQDCAIGRRVDGYLTVEDVIIHKLLAFRSRDQDDIRSILARGLSLDRSYIEHWVAEW